MSADADPAGDLRTAVVDRTRSAIGSGALQPIATELEVVEAAGLSLVVHVGSGLEAKPRGDGTTGGRNPFLPYDPRLFVADLSDDHVCLLNKYCVIEHHLLIVTRTFVDQVSPLESGDLAALWKALQAIGGLGFYNSGAPAGASQRHRHLQLVPLPLPGSQRFPTASLLDSGVDENGLGKVPGLPFDHSWTSLGDLAATPQEAAETLSGLYRQMRASLAVGERAPYNLLLTREWMLMVPRSRPQCEGIEINTLAFAGSLFVRRRADLPVVRRLGLLEMLRRVVEP